MYWFDAGPCYGLTVRTKISTMTAYLSATRRQLGDTVVETAHAILTGDVNGDGKTDLIYWFDAGPSYGLTVRD